MAEINDNFFSGLSMVETERIAKEAQEAINAIYEYLPRDLDAKPPVITNGIVWEVVRAYRRVMGYKGGA